MKTLWIILVGILFLSVQYRPELRTVYGVKVAYQSTGQMYQLVAFFSDGKMQSNRKILSKKEFIHFASGDWPSIYNRNRVNLFDLNDVYGGIYVDSITGEKHPYCFALDNLWKLRYSEFPIKGEYAEPGWSQDKFIPSPAQLKFLKKRYNLENINTQFIIDTNFWNLLHDMSEPDWIEEYKNAIDLDEE